jgi:channel protein (hemolysin III family)
MEMTSFAGFSDPFSSISHIASAVLALIGSFFLLNRGRGNTQRVIGLLIYTFCVIFLFSMSGVYHLLEQGSTSRYVLRVLDHTAIYIMIAGTITPIHLILFRGLNRHLVLTIVWVVSITAVILTAIFFEHIPEWFSLSFYLGLGHVGLFTIYKLYQFKAKHLANNLIFGGLAYTLGAVSEFVRWPVIINNVVGPHEVFHLFVMLGAYFHWCLIYKISKYPISSIITIVVKQYPNGLVKAYATSEHATFEGNSKEDIKKQVFEWIKKKFHNEMQPSKVFFEYRQEEEISL